ncbi:MAG TPA: type II secretion system secretin GspD [Gammaproteobacteria bacterium]
MTTVVHGRLMQVMAVILLAGCAANPPVKETGVTSPAATPPATVAETTTKPQVESESATRPAPQIIQGSGEFINQEAAARRYKAPAQGDVSLNFENTAIEDVIKLILGDLLDVNYEIDPAVKGNVTLKTSKPVKRDALLPILEELLKVNSAALVWSDTFYRITPLTGAVRAASTLRTSHPDDGAGFAVEIMPLRFIAAKEMMKILEPMIPKENILSVDEHRNLLVIGGTSRELRGWHDTVEIFDVDWMSGYSVGVFPLHYTEARTIADELNRVIGEHMNADSAGMVHIEAMERLNSILVLTPQQSYLEQVQGWLERLDRSGEGPSVRLFTYAVKNRKAAELAMVLTNVFGGSGGAGISTTPQASLAPGLKPVKLSTSATSTMGSTTSTTTTDSTTSPAATTAAPTQNLSLPDGGTVRIVADESNNAILVMASAQDYQVVESALKRLDVIEAQVLIEASIMEVSLSDDLNYGLEWYIKRNNVLNGRTGEALLDLNAGKGLGAVIPGFSYSLTGGGVEAVLNALASDSRLNVISSPSLMVLDNRTARITVGDQVPVRTETATTEAGVIIESIQFKDTGVQLEVKPRINAGDLITLDIRQDVTDAGAQDTATGQRSFRQRNIESSIAIQSGETIMLGGLITENGSKGSSGIPILSRIPVLGALFGRSVESKRRTELVVLITPKVVRTTEDATNITDEYRRRMSSMKKGRDRSLAMPEM